MMSTIKLIAFTMFVAASFTGVQAQNDTLVKPAKTPDYDELMDSNYKDSVAAKYVKTKTVTETKKEKKKNYSGNWVIGAGVNSIEDSGAQDFSNLTESKYNHFGSPFMISTEYLTNSKFSFSATFLLNKFQSGKDIQGLTIQSGDEPNYMAVDLAAKMFFRKILYKHVFTPYVTAGPGYRSIGSYQAKNTSDNLVDVPKTQDITLNLGFGAYYWFNRSWGLNLNYIAKFALKVGDNKDYKTNHLVPSFGVFYRFNTD
ncbi:MAG TPA: hypothetical protein VIS27_06130 [Yeosuana sp.]